MSHAHLTPLQGAFKHAHDKYGRGGTLNKRIVAELSSAMITLNDSDLPLDDLRTVGGFLASNVARTELRLIVVRRTVVVAGRSNTSKGRQKQKSKTDHIHAAYSAFRAAGGSLLTALCDCVARCRSLHCLVVDGVDFNEDMMRRFGASIARCPSNMGRLRFQDCSFGDAGFRAITPYLARSRSRVLELVKCGLSDTSMSYVASILKAQEGNMDHTFWNETLRVSPMDFGGKNAGVGAAMSSATGVNGALPWEPAGPKVKAIRAQVPGLKVLSLAGNTFSDKSMYTIGKFLRHNQWLTGLNLAHNGISVGGIKHLANALATNTALHTLVIAGNPGYRREIGTVLDSMSQSLPSMEGRAVQSSSSNANASTSASGVTQKGGSAAGGTTGGLADTLERYGGYLVRQGAEAALEDWGCNASMEDANAEAEKDHQATTEALLHGGTAPKGDKSGSGAAAAPAAAIPLPVKKTKKKKALGLGLSVPPSRMGMETGGATRPRPATASQGGKRGDVDKQTKQTKIKSPAVGTTTAATAVDDDDDDDSVGSPARTPRSKQPASASPSPKTVGRATPTKSPTAAKKVTTRVGDRQRQQASKAGKADAPCEAEVREMVRESLRRQLVTHLRG